MEEITNSYLSFTVGSQHFAIHVGKVNEIREYEKPRNVPEAISFMKGVIDHRDEVVPVIDTAIKFNLPSTEITLQTCIIIIEVTKADQTTFKIGIITDAVTDVFEADPELFKKIDNEYKPGYIDSTYNYNNNHYLMIDVDKVFSTNEIIEFDKILSAL